VESVLRISRETVPAAASREQQTQNPDVKIRLFLSPKGNGKVSICLVEPAERQMYLATRTRASGALLLSFLFVLLPPSPRAGKAIADDRVLRVHDGASDHAYTVAALVSAVGLTEFEVAKDPHFGPNRVFAGFALEPLLQHIGLGDARELLLVCEDGYRIPFDVSALLQSPRRALLAVRDTALPADGNTHWPSYRHGTETIDFDPFYLVWASADEHTALDTETLPWPFQLIEIRHFDRAAYFAPARPPPDAGEAVHKGFAAYTAHCGKCHRMRGVGGEVGPALDREYSLSSVLTREQLLDYIRHDEGRYARSKMPRFSKLLSAAEIDQVTSYVRAMQPARKQPPSKQE
jgi:mono/diheme cytochrome c family protein